MTLGIAITDSEGATRSVSDVFSDAADAIAALPTQADRAIAAYELLGRQGIRLLPILQQGSAALEENLESFRRFGVLSTAQSQALKDLDQSFTDLATATRTGLAAAVAEASGTFRALNERLVEVIPRIAGDVVGAVVVLVENLRVLGEALRLVVSFIAGRRLIAAFSTFVTVMRSATLGVRGLSLALGALARFILLPVALIEGLILVVQVIADLGRDISNLDDDFGSAGEIVAKALVREFLNVVSFLPKIMNEIFKAISAEFDLGIEGLRRRALDFLSDPFKIGARTQARGQALQNTGLTERDVRGDSSNSQVRRNQAILNAEIERLIAEQNVQGEGQGETRDFVTRVADALREGLQRGLDAPGLGDLLIGDADAVGISIGGTIVENVQDRLVDLRETFTSLFGGDLPEAAGAGIDAIDTDLDLLDAKLDETAAKIATVAGGGATIAGSAAKEVETLAEQIFPPLERGFRDFFESTILRFEDLGDAVRDLGQLIVRELLNRLIVNPLASAAADALSGFLGGVDGARQFGGPVQANRSYLVGEAGPELFVPDVAGTIVPNQSFGGPVFNFAPVIAAGARGADVDAAIARAYPVFEAQIRSGILTDLKRPSTFSR